MTAPKSTTAAAKDSAPPVEPEFLRFSDAFERYRLRRGHLYRLIESGKVRAVSLRGRGAIRGVRLIDHQSLRDFIFSHVEDSAAADA